MNYNQAMSVSDLCVETLNSRRRDLEHSYPRSSYKQRPQTAMPRTGDLFSFDLLALERRALRNQIVTRRRIETSDV